MSQEFFSNEAISHFAQSFPQTLQKLVEKKSFIFKYTEVQEEGLHYYHFIPFQISYFIVLKLETFSSKEAEDKFVFNNHIAEV